MLLNLTYWSQELKCFVDGRRLNGGPGEGGVNDWFDGVSR